MGKPINLREERILNAAIELAEADGYQWITRDRVAERAGVSTGTVSNTFGSIVELKRAVLRAAIERRNLRIVGQGLADEHPIVMGAPEALRRETAAYLANA